MRRGAYCVLLLKHHEHLNSNQQTSESVKHCLGNVVNITKRVFELSLWFLQVYSDLSSSFTSEDSHRAGGASSVDTASSVFSESIDTTSTLFSDSASEFAFDSASDYQLSAQALQQDAASGHAQSVSAQQPNAQLQQQRNELLQRRQYYLTHAVAAPRPYLHDSFNIPPCMTHSVDYVNDTAKLVSDVDDLPQQTTSPVFYSQAAIASSNTENQLQHSLGDSQPSEAVICEHKDTHGSNTLPRRGKSKRCVLESHGRLTDTNARSLDLLDEALSKCDAEDFGKLSSHVINSAVPGSTCSVGTLHSSTQTLSSHTLQEGVLTCTCDNSQNIRPEGFVPGLSMPSISQPYLEDYIDPVCHNCTKHSSTAPTTNSVSMSTLHQVGRPKQRGVNSARGLQQPQQQQQQNPHCSNLQSQHSASECHVGVGSGSGEQGASGGGPGSGGGGASRVFTHSRGELNGFCAADLAQAQSEASFLNPNQPLQYVDLGRFDGRVEGEWTHSATQPRSSSLEGYVQPRSTSVDPRYTQPRSSSLDAHAQTRLPSGGDSGYHVMNGGVTLLPPSGKNVHGPSNGDHLNGRAGGARSSTGRSPSQFTPEYQQELIMEQARQQAQQDLQHSYVNLGAALPQNMSNKVRNHYVNVSIHHMNMNSHSYVNMTEEFGRDSNGANATVAPYVNTGPEPKDKDWRKQMLAYHNSLKRPRSADSRTRTTAYSEPEKESSSSAVPFTRARGKSLDNIFSGSEFDVVMPIHINDDSNGGERSSGPKSPRRSVSVDSANVEAKKAPVKPALPPRSKKPPVSLPLGAVQTGPGVQAGKKATLVRPATAPALGRLVGMSPSSPGSSRASSGTHTPVSPLARSPPPPPAPAATSTGSDYMMMQGFPREDSESPIFCAVELPRRNASFSSHSTRSRNCSFSSAYSSEDQASYVDMSLGHGSSKSSPTRDIRAQRKARLLRESSMDAPSRPKLMQSRSLDNELEDNYLKMDLGTSAPSTSGRKGHAHEDYMCMSPSGGDSQDEAQLVASSGDELENDARSTGSGGAAEKPAALPFDNLIDHLPYTNRQKIFVPKSKNAASGSNTPPLPDPPSTTSQSKRFLSRLIRRNSTKDRKSSKASTSSTEECLSPPNEPAIPEGAVSETQGRRSTLTIGTGPQQHRKASWDDRGTTGEQPYENPKVSANKGRSMSYSTGMPPPPGLPPTGAATLPYQGSNLTDEEKQQSSSIMTRMGLGSAGRGAGSPDTARTPTFVPAPACKDPEAFSPPPKMVDSPAYMLVVPGQIPTTMTNSDHKFMSKSDVTPSFAERDYEPELPPTLPRKTGKRRKSREIILTSPTSSFQSNSSRSSSNDRNLSSPASTDLLSATDDGKASSTSSSAATSPRSTPRNQDNWLLVNIPAAQQPDHVASNSNNNTDTDVWIHRSAQGNVFSSLFIPHEVRDVFFPACQEPNFYPVSP